MASPHDVTRLLKEWANGAQPALEALNVSEVTVKRDWQFAKTWLLRELSQEKSDGT